MKLEEELKQQHVTLTKEEKARKGRQGFEALLDSIGDVSFQSQAKLQHCKYHYMGYRDTMLGKKKCPFKVGTAPYRSWMLGHVLAVADKAEMTKG